MFVKQVIGAIYLVAVSMPTDRTFVDGYISLHLSLFLFPLLWYGGFEYIEPSQ